ncbi:S9 family peptidase [Aliidiomarina celeris]|uniref:S9 family peptidase n=1 Tax=Aliidiomarina celeris TaxID=2249428 RepID=UPI000DEBDF0F
MFASFVSDANTTVRPLQLDDVFELEFAADPQPSPSGEHIVFVRTWMDREQDRRRSSLWMMNSDGSNLQALTDRNINASSPRWSPTGDRIAFLANGQIQMLWLDSGRTAQVTTLQQGAGSIEWSPDGNWLAFSMFTPKAKPAPVSLPGKPAQAEWAAPPIYIDDMNYRADGRGFLASGYSQIYLVSAQGGSAIQLTEGDFNHGGALSWQHDGKALFFSANRYSDWQSQPLNSEIFKLDLDSRELTQLTDRFGPDANPQVSPNGELIAYVGFDDRRLAHQHNRLYVMNADGSNVRALTADLDQGISQFQWQPNSRGLVVGYVENGAGIIAEQPLRGERRVLANDWGGLSYSRPYSGGQFSLSSSGYVAYTQSSTAHPAELATVRVTRRPSSTTLTALNADLLMKRTVGEVEEFWYRSSVDEKPIQGWIMYPPGFDASQQYPLILEIHGGPHTAYGPYFAMELQLMAAQGYVVLYTNPRGSTSYGEDFANLIHHNYPSHDYNDLMDGVDAVLARGFINEDELFITGGSGGGVLTTWTIGHTDRFAAAVAVNPVINWYSFVLNADMYNYFSQYWFPGLPWDMPEHYLKYSPISYVGNVSTPTMLFTGESDHRTPISETEQYYQALQLRGIESAMVRVPGASHALHTRPSNHMAKPAYVIHWFEKFRASKGSGSEE